MSRGRTLILPGYLLLCLLLGGSSQNVWGNALLQSLAVGIIAWSLLTPQRQPLPKQSRRPLWLITAVALLFAIQLLPLPPGIWRAIPHREFLVAGFGLLRQPLPWLPISIAPYDTLATALTLLPPLALIVGMLRLREWSVENMFLALLGGSCISILLGTLQVSGGERWYFYETTNIGVGVGTFANGNHFATLLLVAMPAVAALAVTSRRAARTKEKRASTTAVAMGALAILVVGLSICRSASILLLGPPVAAASVALAFRLSKNRLRQAYLGVAALVAIAGAALVFAGDSLPGWGTGASIETRKEYWAKSADAALDQAFTGWGFGTFQQVYRTYEDPLAVNRFFVNHAHNDYVELAVEGGVPAFILLIVFLFWWGGRVGEAWSAPSASVEQRAASIFTAAILLHSFFDFPLRTAAISTTFALGLALLAGAKGALGKEAQKERHAVRHAQL